MSYEFITFEVKDAVAVLTLNRPSVLNSFTRPMARETQGALSAVEMDDSIRALLLTGAGRAFCAGQDLAEAAPDNDPTRADIGNIVETTYNPIIRAIRSLEKPVICAVNGVAAGAGANLALACDFVFAAESASFIQAFCKIGLIPDSGGTYFLPRLAGLARATAMMMTGEKIPAQRALEWGLIYRVFPDGELMDQATAFAVKMAGQPTKALGLIKRAINQSLSNDLKAQLELERRLQSEAGETEDYVEGVKAFLEKREPVFRGK